MYLYVVGDSAKLNNLLEYELYTHKSIISDKDIDYAVRVEIPKWLTVYCESCDHYSVRHGTNIPIITKFSFPKVVHRVDNKFVYDEILTRFFLGGQVDIEWLYHYNKYLLNNLINQTINSLFRRSEYEKIA